MTSIQPSKGLFKPSTVRFSAVILAASLAACSSGVSDGDGTSSAQIKELQFTAEGLDRDSPLMLYMASKGSDTGASGDSTEPSTDQPQGTSPTPPPAAAQNGTGGKSSATPTPTEPSADASTPPSGTESNAKPSLPAGAVNTVDTVISDMRELNEGSLLRVNPTYGFARGPGYVIQGNDPRGTNTPSWFQNAYPNLINGNYWNYILPWMVIFEGVGNGSSNARVHLRNMKLYVKSRTSGTWSLLSQAQTTGGSYCAQDSNYFACSHADGERQEPGGGVSFDTRPGQNFHGYFGGYTQINGPDVAAVFVTMHARLVSDSQSAPDDLAKAKYLLHVGADYYREAAPASTVGPGVGNSRAKYIRQEWQAFSMMTFSDVGIQEPGGGITAAAFRANPPPLE